MSFLKIGQLARAAGVRIDTVRYYERRGLIAEPPRRASGYRAYPPETVRILKFIRRAQELGFTLKEIDELLGLRVDDRSACAEVHGLAEAKAADIERRIEQLTAMRNVLVDLARLCSTNGTSDDPCPILKALDSEEKAIRSEELEKPLDPG